MVLPFFEKETTMALSTDDKVFLTNLGNFLHKIVNRIASDDPNNDGRLTREGMKTAIQQQVNSDCGSQAKTLPFSW